MAIPAKSAPPSGRRDFGADPRWNGRRGDSSTRWSRNCGTALPPGACAFGVSFAIGPSSPRRVFDRTGIFGRSRCTFGSIEPDCSGRRVACTSATSCSRHGCLYRACAIGNILCVTELMEGGALRRRYEGLAELAPPFYLHAALQYSKSKELASCLASSQPHFSLITDRWE
jgi:hypothetical protein